MNWILLADDQTTKTAEPSGQHKRIDQLRQGQVFSINGQAKRFELVMIDLSATEKNPGGRIIARVKGDDGSYGDDVTLDYSEYKDQPLLVLQSVESPSEVKGLELYDRIRLKGTDLCGCAIDVDRSVFPECNVVVIWDQPLRGDMITQVHAHEVEDLGERLTARTKVGERSLAELRQVVLDLRANEGHEQRQDDRARENVRQQVNQALQQQATAFKQHDEAMRRQAQVVRQAFNERHALELRQMAEACVLHVTAGEANYEIEQMSGLLTSYADRLWQLASQVTSDPELATITATEVMHTIADVAWQGYFMTRFAYVREEEGRCCVLSEKGKRLGSYASKDKAVKRIRQIEYWKRHGAEVDVESLVDLEDVR